MTPIDQAHADRLLAEIKVLDATIRDANRKRTELLSSLVLVASPYQVGDIVHLKGRQGKKAVIRRLQLPYTPSDTSAEMISREVRGDMSYLNKDGTPSAKVVGFHWWDRAVVIGKIAKEGGAV